MREAPSGRRSEPDRLEAFSDGVLAVIITIMAFELKAPPGTALHDVGKVLPNLLVYILSFAFIGIYWNNHHHLLRSTERISPAVMWANLHLLFWLSLVPVVTQYLAGYYQAHLPASVYGVVALGAGIAYAILARAIIASNGADSDVAQAIGADRKGSLSILVYALGVGLAWVTPWISYGFYVGVALVWFIPDRRLEQATAAE
jgi:uncharacterized membrane protein